MIMCMTSDGWLNIYSWQPGLIYLNNFIMKGKGSLSIEIPSEANRETALGRVFRDTEDALDFFSFFLSSLTVETQQWGGWRWATGSFGNHFEAAALVTELNVSLRATLQLLAFFEDWYIFLCVFNFCSKFSLIVQQPMKRNDASCAQWMPPSSHPYPHIPLCLTLQPILLPDSDRRPREEEDSDGESCSTLNPWRHGT